MAIKRNIDITAAAYAVVRQAFNQTLQLCVSKISKAEARLAEEILDADILDADILDEDDSRFHEMLSDTALYSRKDTLRGLRKKRAIDRVAPIAERVRDPLRSAIAARRLWHSIPYSQSGQQRNRASFLHRISLTMTAPSRSGMMHFRSRPPRRAK